MLKLFHKWKFLELVSLLSWVLESEHRILECFTPVTPPWCTCCCCLVFLLKLAVYFDHKLNNIIIILIFNDFNMPFPLLTVTSCNSDPQQLLSFCLRDTHTRMRTHTRRHTHTRLLHSLESPVCCQVLTGKGNLSSPAQLTSGHAKVLGPMCVGWMPLAKGSHSPLYSSCGRHYNAPCQRCPHPNSQTQRTMLLSTTRGIKVPGGIKIAN